MITREKIRRTQIEKARNGLLNFTVYTKPDFDIHWHHVRIARTLNAFVRGEIKFLMIFAPPRHGKSELVSRRLPAYIHGLYPDDEIMCASYLDSLAGDMCTDVQKVMDSKEYKDVFPDVKLYPPGTRYAEGTRNSSEHHIVGRRGKYRGQGVGGSFTGKGANWIIVDDPIKGREIADSVAFRERLWNFWNNDLFSRLETNLRTGRTGQALITQTRWHEDDLSGRLIEKMRKDPQAVQWHILNLPAIKTSIDDPEDPREIGEPLWPKKFDLFRLNQIKASAGVRAWSSLYQQDPTPDGGTLFNSAMFSFCRLPDQFDYTFIMADTAYREKEESDFTCFTKFGVSNEQLFILDVYYKQIKSSEVEAEVRPFIKGMIHYGYRGTYIEPKGHGIYLNQKFEGEGLLIPSEDDRKEFYADRRFDKVERANNVIPHLSNRKVYINEQIGNKEELVAQCLNFPKVKHDDFVDTLIDGLKFVYCQEPDSFTNV